MKTSLKENIMKRFKVNYLKGKDGFVNSQSIQDYAHENFKRDDGTQYKHETIGRRLRELAEEQLLESKLMDGKNISSIAYKYIPSEKEIISQQMKFR